jgi:hypothetical protein
MAKLLSPGAGVRRSFFRPVELDAANLGLKPSSNSYR